MSDVRRAAIDIGTVSTRLLVADVDGDRRVREVLRRTVVTHLGEGLTEAGRLSEDAMARTAGVVQGFMKDAAEHHAEDFVAVATSASRDAENAEEFLDSLAGKGIRPVVISGTKEAELSFVGATYEVDDEDVLVADLGGGSTELIFGSATGGEDGEREVDMESSRSIDVGSRRMCEKFLTSDPPSRDQLEDAAEWAVDEFRSFFNGLRRPPKSMISLAGTATTLVAIKKSLEVYDPTQVHGERLYGGDLANLKEELAALPLAERKKVTGLDPERAEVIVAGALILETLVGMAGLDSTLVSEHDILYGLVLEGACGLEE